MKTKRFLSILLSLVLVLGMLPGMSLTASAEGNTKTITPGTDDAKTGTGTMTITLKIKAAQTITASDVTATYGDTDKSVSASVTTPATGGGAISYAVKEGSGDYISVASDGKLTIKKVPPTDGKAYVIVTAAATDDYAETTKEVTVTVGKADQTAPTGLTATKASSSTAADGKISGVTSAMEYQKNDASAWIAVENNKTEITGLASGTYKVRYKETADKNASPAANVEVGTKTDQTAPTGLTATKASSSTAADGKISNVTDAMEYQIDGATTWTAVGENQTEITGLASGTYKVRYAGTADKNASHATSVEVGVKATQTITASDVTTIYGDTDKFVSASVTDPAEGSGAISYAVKSGSENYIDVNASTGALTIKAVPPTDGKAYVTVTAAETNDCLQATKDVTVTISKADSTPATVTANNRTYDSTEKPLVTVTGEATGGEMQYALGNETEATQPYTTSIPSKTNAGTYYVWYKVKGDENHNDTEPECVKVTISAPAHTHTPGEWKEIPGTCTVEGYKTTHCTDCNALIELHNGELDPNNHVNTEIRDAKEATETEEGYTGDTWCKDCGKKIKDGEVIPATGKPDEPQPTEETTYADLSKAEQKDADAIAKANGVDKDTAAQMVKTAQELGVSMDTVKLSGDALAKMDVDSKDAKGTDFGKLTARATKRAEKTMTLQWTKQKDADGYLIYSNLCGKGNKMKLVKTIKKNGTVKWTQKKLKKGKYYKYMVVAYKNVNGEKMPIAASVVIHVPTKGGKTTAAKSVTVKQGKKVVSKLTVKKGKSVTVKVTENKEDKKLKVKTHRAVKFESSNKKIATVNAKGKITGKKKGTCTVWEYAQNGIFKAIKVTVK